MRYQIVLFIQLFFLVLSASAQTAISGKVNNQSGEALDHASIIAYSYPDSIMLGYAISGVDGTFSFSLNLSSDSILIVVRSLGYLKAERILPAESAELKFELKDSKVILEEVVIKSDPIVKEGDTLIYDVNAFTHKQDKSLEDVLKKMPGLKVQENGQIIYQGRAINKLYIDGKDLLESRYMIATQNIPPDAVTVIEVMKNHQPIRMLQDVVNTVDPAINIVLKPGITLTGSAEVSGGTPKIWRSKIAPMIFSKKHQIVNELTTTNSGDDYLLKFKSVNLLEYLDYGEMIFQSENPVLGNGQFSSDLFARRDYNFNTSHSISSNYITSLKKGDIKLNIDAYHDLSNFDRTDRLEFFSEDQNLSVLQRDKSEFRSLYFRPKAVYEHNQPDHYFKNTLKLKMHETEDITNVSFNGANSIDQRVDRTFLKAENLFDNIIKIGDSYLRFLSYTSYSKHPELLVVNPTPLVSLPIIQSGENISQNVTVESFSGFIGTSLIKKWKKYSFESKIGFNYFNDNLESDISDGNIEIPDFDYRNDLEYRRISPSVTPRLSYKENGLSITVKNEIRYESIQIENFSSSTSTSLSKPVQQPELLFSYKWKSFTLRSNLFRRLVFSKIPGVHDGFIVNNYRTISEREVPIQNSEQTGFLTAIDLEILQALLMLHSEIRYTNGTRNWIMQYNFDDQGANDIAAIGFEENNVTNRFFLLGLDAFSLAISTNLSAKFNFARTQEPSILVSSFTDIETTSTNYRIETNTSINNNLSIKFVYEKVNRTGIFGTTETSFNQQILGSTLLYSIKNHNISISDRVLDQSRSVDRINMLDFTYGYQIPDKKMQIEFSGRNLLDETVFVQTVIDPQTTSTTSFPLRSRQILLSIRFQF
ncbi:MAG: hypothetical protein RIM99_04700 [Cyclobacteriaceae bacterium]